VADLVGHSLPYEAFQRNRLDVFDHAGDNIAFAAYGSDDNGFARSACSTFAAATLVFVPILGETADESFINLDDPHELLEFLINQRSSDAVAHVPSRPVRTEAHVAFDMSQSPKVPALPD
jgi:hypothetical protein